MSPASTFLKNTLWGPTWYSFSSSVAPAPVARRMLRSLIMFSCSRILPCSPPMRSTISAGAHFSFSEAPATMPARFRKSSRDRVPAMASILLRPAETLDSDVILTRPICPVERQWVPPQSSFETPSPMITRRTSSPYFSSKSAMAPLAIASSLEVISVRMGRSSRTYWFTIASTRSSSSRLTAVKWVKSNLSLVSSTSDPDWCTCSPSTSRSAR